jgi:microcystin-dependent protein
MAYLGEIRPVGFNFSTVGWAFCDGQLLQISQYEALFALIGTTYGGDGQTTFGLPDLRGRIPIHMGTSPQGETFALGQAAGSESVTLSTSQMPTHAHSFSFQPQASGNAGSQTSPANAYYAGTGRGMAYGTVDTVNGTMAAPAVQTGSAGGNQPVSLIQPYQVVNYIIAVEGIFPSRN